MVLPEFEYYAATSLEEASKLLYELGPGAMPMAGGSDTVPPIKDRAIKPTAIVDLKRIPGLNYIEYDEEEGLKIGCLTKLFDIQESELIHRVNPAVAEAAKYVASTQVRNLGTMVGNICNASPSCDTAPILIAMNAKVLVHGYGYEKEILVKDFFKGVKKTVLELGEVATGLVIPPLKENEFAAYTPLTVRKALDLAMVGVAAWLKMDGNICVDCRLALGAVAPTPIRAYKAEEYIIGKEITEEVLHETGLIAMRNCSPISDVRASAEYRRDMVRVFTKRAIKRALSM